MLNGSSGVAQATYNCTDIIGVQENWSFITTAQQAGTYTYHWTYKGFHSYYQAIVELNSAIDSTITNLIAKGPADHGEEPAGGFTYSGTTTFVVTAGQTYGFKFSGFESDSAAILRGTLTVVADGVTAAQTLTFNQPADQNYSSTPTLSASATSGLPPAFDSSTPSVCTITGSGILAFLSTGVCTINANQAGNNTFAAAPTVTRSFNVVAVPGVPVAGAVNMTVEIGSSNNVVPLALTGGAAASVAVSTAPLHGEATASGTVITYTPVAGYLGNDSFTYTATNAGGTSPAGTVSILVQPRPDPSKDAEVIALLNAQVQMAKRFGQTQIGNFQTHLEGLHARSRALSQDGQRFASRGKAQTPVESTATSLTEFSSTNTTAGNHSSASIIPRVSNLTTNERCQAWNMNSCMVSGSLRTTGDGMDSPIPGTLTTAGTRSDWWPWPTLSVNGSSKDLLGSGMNVWSAGTVNVGKQSENDTRFTTSGISVGGDNHVTDTLTLGIGAGFGHERQKIGSNDTTNRGDSYSVVVYGSYQPQDGFFIDGLVGYGHLSFDADRYVTSTGDMAQSSRNGTQWFSSLSGGYEYVEGKFLLSPYGRFDMVHTRLDQSTEDGGGIYNLTYLDQTSRSSKLSLGLRGETTFEIDNGTVKPSLRFEYQHEFTEPGVANMMYADDLNGRVYALDMENTDHNTMVLGLGLDFALCKSWQTGLSYKFSHSTSSSSQMQSFGIHLRRAF